MKPLPKHPSDIDPQDVDKYALKHELNTDSEQNWRDARQNLFDELHGKNHDLCLLYEMKDDIQDQGILKTDLPEDFLQIEWSKFYSEDTRANNALEQFVEYCISKFPQFKFEQIWFQATIYP